MKKILFILAFSNLLTSELILEITQGTEDPYRVAILKFDGDQKVSNDIDKIIRNNLKRSGEFNLFEMKIYSQSHPMKVKLFLMILKF